MRGRQRSAIAVRYTLYIGNGYLSSFLSLLSMLGLVLAIALLIIVLSVMNGFEREMRDNILSLVPQLTIKSWRRFADWQGVAARLAEHPGVRSVTPYAELQGLLLKNSALDTALVVGVAPLAAPPDGLGRALAAGVWERFAADANGVILGQALARGLGLQSGDWLSLLVPGPGTQAAVPAYHHLRLSGVLRSATELDHTAALIQLETAARLLGDARRIDGFRLQLHDLFAAPRIGRELTSRLPRNFYATDWTRTHGNLYAAIQLSREIVGLLLLSIIAIAAFNLVSSLVLVVTDKRSDIAILRALGASPGDINGIFLRQGLLIAAVGMVLGSALGIAGSLLVTDAVAALEGLLGMRFLNTDVYPIGYLPADLLPSDVLLINATALLLCFVATLYPARRAARVPPAEALRQE